MYKKELARIAERTVGRDIIVTRNHRAVTQQFDTDFRWYGYIGHVAEPGDEVVIVTSPTTLNQAMKVIAYSHIMHPSVKVRLLIHPLVRVIDRKIQVSRMSIGDFLEFLETPLRARMFLALCMQWQAYESVVGTEEIHFVIMTANMMTGSASVEKCCTPETFAGLYQRNLVNVLYKQIRSKKPISAAQAQLINAIKPSE